MTSPVPRLLVIDDEPDLRTLYELTLVREGYDVDTAGSVREALDRLGDTQYQAVITDMRLPDGSGLDVLQRLEREGRRERAIVITAFGSAENAVEALKAGAYDYLTKPVDLRQFRLVVASAMGRVTSSLPATTSGGAGAIGAPAAGEPPSASPAPRAARRAAVPAELPGERQVEAPALIGNSPAMQQVRSLVDKVARSMAPVLVQGESGTGKELVARAIHRGSPRAAQAFLAVNCSAIPEALLEAEFFGYRKGAFTGANEDRAGFFQAAHGGTLFLDEIGDLPLAMQSKLLRAIQERCVRPVGAVAEMPVNVRLISATHRDLAAEVQAGRFRQDLFYRLNVIRIHIPPLRERLDDLAVFAEAMLARLSREAGVDSAPTLSPQALSRLSRYSFPGNVRELENLLHRAVALSGSDTIEAADLGLGDEDADSEWPSTLGAPLMPALSAEPVSDRDPAQPLPSDLARHLDEVERDILQRALKVHRYNRTAAGASMGLTLRQMRYRMARLGIVEPGLPDSAGGQDD